MFTSLPDVFDLATLFLFLLKRLKVWHFWAIFDSFETRKVNNNLETKAKKMLKIGKIGIKSTLRQRSGQEVQSGCQTRLFLKRRTL